MRGKVSQDELDALLHSTSNAQPDPSTHLRSPGEAEPFVVRAEDRLRRSPMPGLDAINLQFARQLQTDLRELISQTPTATPDSLQVRHYSAFIEELSLPTHCSVVSLAPLAGHGLIACELKLVLALIDARFSAAGRPAPELTRDNKMSITATEQRMVDSVGAVIIAAHNRAWQGFFPLTLALQRAEMDPKLAHIAAADERVVTTRFEVTFGDTVGVIRTCFPIASLAPLRALMKSTTQGHRPVVDDLWRQHLQTELQSISLTLAARLARFDVTVAKLLSMKAGDVLPFDARPHIEATVDGVPVFACEYGTANGRYALCIAQRLQGNDPGQHGGRDGR